MAPKIFRAMAALRSKLNLNWFRERARNGQQEVDQWRKELNGWWSRLTPGERVFAPICALNVLVFSLWRIPRLQPLMVRYFSSNTAARAVCWPMFLSTLSHYSLFHIAANMYVLHSFSHAAVATLGREQFLGLYLSAGVVASFASHVFKTVMRQPGLSLGASGAIMAVLAYVCTQYPDTQLSIVFLLITRFRRGPPSRSSWESTWREFCLGGKSLTTLLISEVRCLDCFGRITAARGFVLARGLFVEINKK